MFGLRHNTVDLSSGPLRGKPRGLMWQASAYGLVGVSLGILISRSVEPHI